MLERVFVRLPNWLGDALMARPALLAMRAAHPEAHVTACGPAGVLALLAPDRAWDAAEPWPLAPARAAGLAASRLDVALVLAPSFSSAWSAWRMGARRRVGFRGDGRRWLLTDALPREPRGDRHLSREYLALAARVGAGAWRWQTLEVPEQARSAARERWGPAPYAVLGPGAQYGPAKRWPAARFADVARRLAASGLEVRVCGGPGDAEACEEVARAGGARSLASSTSLEELAALCADADRVVCNDSGLAHLAGAVGAPTVAVFGSTSSAWTAPLGPRVRVVQHPPACSPCFRRTCRIGYACLHAVSVEEVLFACEEARAA
jgi:heptosyltransferase-2